MVSSRQGATLSVAAAVLLCTILVLVDKVRELFQDYRTMRPTQKVHASLARYNPSILRVFKALNVFLSNLEAEDSIGIALQETRQQCHCDTNSILTWSHRTGHLTYGNRWSKPSLEAKAVAAIQILFLPSSP